MKIAHISIIPSFSPGIFKKLEDKANIAKEYHLGMDFYLLNPVKSYTKDNLFLVKKTYRFLPTRFLKTIFFRIFKLYTLEQCVPLAQYDAIILRYPLVDGFGNQKFLKKYGNKIFTEHHSDEISELRSMGRMVDKIRAFLEMSYSSYFLSHVRGIIGVTDEIRKIELAKIPQVSPSIVVANGINPQSFIHTDFLSFDGKYLNMIFVASEFVPWHGLEILLESCDVYQGECCIVLHLVGRLSQLQQEKISLINNKKITIIVHGNIYGKALDTLFENVTLAISSLALSKKNMKEACTLKSREYIVRGIPFIYAYKDTDLKGDEIFAKRLDEGIINFSEIISFAHLVSNQKSLVQDTMSIEVHEISWLNKLKQMQSFIRENL